MKKITSAPYLGRRSELTFSPDGKYLFHTQGQEVIALNVPWLTSNFSIVTPWKGDAQRVVLHKTRPLLAVLGDGSRYSEIRADLPIYNFETRELVEEICIIGTSVNRAVFVGDELLPYAGIFGTYLYSFKEETTVAWMPGGEAIYSMSLHPDGRTLMITHSSQSQISLEFLDVYENAYEMEKDISAHSDPNKIDLKVLNLSSALFSPRGNYFVVTHNSVLLYRYPECELLRTINTDGKSAEEYSASIYWSNAVFSPDSRFLYCGSHDGFIYCWAVNSGELIEKTRANDGEIWQLAISPDGQLLASSGRDYSLTLWDLSL